MTSTVSTAWRPDLRVAVVATPGYLIDHRTPMGPPTSRRIAVSPTATRMARSVLLEQLALRQ